MDAKRPNRHEVENAIRSVFGKARRPGCRNVVYDQSGYHTECNELRLVLSDKHWSDLTDDQLAALNSALYFLTEPGAIRLVREEVGVDGAHTMVVEKTLDPERFRPVRLVTPREA
jgi:hypothetical protein